MNRKIPLEDVFECLCEYDECSYNYKGECDYGDCVTEYMTYSMGDDFATCNVFKVKEGFCECGCVLTKYVDMLPYGDTYVPYEYYECDNC